MGKKARADLGVLFTKNVLPGLASNLASNTTSNVIGKLRRKISEKRAVRVGK